MLYLGEQAQRIALLRVEVLHQGQPIDVGDEHELERIAGEAHTPDYLGQDTHGARLGGQKQLQLEQRTQLAFAQLATALDDDAGRRQLGCLSMSRVGPFAQ